MLKSKNVRRGHVLQKQLQRYCLLTSITTLLACVIGFSTVAVALTPLATYYCVMLLPKAAVDAIKAIQDLVKILELNRLNDLRVIESSRVRWSLIELERGWRNLCPNT